MKWCRDISKKFPIRLLLKRRNEKKVFSELFYSQKNFTFSFLDITSKLNKVIHHSNLGKIAANSNELPHPINGLTKDRRLKVQLNGAAHELMKAKKAANSNPDVRCWITFCYDFKLIFYCVMFSGARHKSCLSKWWCKHVNF